MKQISFSVKQVVTSVMLLFLGSQCMQAQTSPSTLSTMSIQTDAVFGPTLYICSSKPTNDYTKSKALAFGVPVPYSGGNPNPSLGSNPHTRNSGFVLVKVGGNSDGIDEDGAINTNSGVDIIKTAGSWLYLDDAINFFLTQNYQRIVILEGEYEVDGPIEIDKVLGTNNHIFSIGNITIEGEGFGTKINPASGYTGNIFEVKSHYNTIKNLAIHIEGTGTGIYVAQDATVTAADPNGVSREIDNYHNTFENLYIGHKALYGSTTQTDVAARGIVLDGQYKDVGYNKFNNIVIKGLHTGITFRKGAVSGARIHDNTFTNVNLARVVRGIFFDSTNLQETAADGSLIYDDISDNIFTNFSLQTANITENFVHNVYGRNNTFTNFKAADWGKYNSGIAHRAVFSISSKAQHTTIQNSEVGRGSVLQIKDGIVDPTNTDANPTLTPSKYLQLINNFGGNGDVTYMLGNNKNASNISARSVVEILGKLKITANSHTGSAPSVDDPNDNNPTFGDGKVLTSDANGYATWKDLGSLAWNHIATKNIKMDGFAITNHSNATPATNTDAGLRLDNNGNVRIGTTAPDTTNPAKLQVDGRVFVGTPSTATNDYDANYKLLVNGKVLVRNEVYVKQDGIGWADYVFAKDYKLMPLQEVEQHIQEKGHLPNMPSASEVEKDGIAVGDIIKRQQEKIEELTLYLIEMKKQNDELQNRMEVLEQNQKKN